MLKKLRMKFVCIMMTVVTVMLGIIIALVIHFTGQALENQSIRMLESLGSNPFQLSLSEEDGEQFHFPFFTVQIGRRGQMIATGGNFNLSNEQLLDIIQLAMASEEQMGILENYSLRYRKSTSPSGLSILFADITSEQEAMSSLTISCLLIGAVSFLVFLAISLLLAQWAVKPVAKAWEQQRQFVADASHELKTPLAVIMTNAELLQLPEQEKSVQDQYAENILAMSRQMRTLVESLLDLARVDNGAVKTAFETLDMSRLVENSILPFEPLYFERELSLSTSIEKNISLRGSAAHLHQVVDILLDNALKYSTPHGRIQVRLEQHGHQCLLSVMSTGEPISPADLKNIFKRFYRIDKARSRNGSYGLGLSIAQSIVAEHDGKIWAESEMGINTFFVQLPTL